jgi:farnesyl diphosphate synthase
MTRAAPALAAGADWMVAHQQRLEQAAAAALPAPDAAPDRLHQAMRYAVLGGGKRVRALLVYAAGEFAGAGDDALDCAALAVEYVHAYSLIHDDLPCMDDDVVRRGKPTVHVAFDEATAMLAGDALQAEAFRVLAEARLPADARAELMRTLAQAIGTAGMCGGQALDLQAVGTALTLGELERMHRMKTGALVAASARMGALCARSPDQRVLDALDRYGRAIGLAFQVVDDILDVQATDAQLGKTAGKDVRQSKPTYVSTLGLAAAHDWARRLHADALDALAGFGPQPRRLRELADFIVLRSH